MNSDVSHSTSLILFPYRVKLPPVKEFQKPARKLENFFKWLSLELLKATQKSQLLCICLKPISREEVNVCKRILSFGNCDSVPSISPAYVICLHRLPWRLGEKIVETNKLSLWLKAQCMHYIFFYSPIHRKLKILLLFFSCEP